MGHSHGRGYDRALAEYGLWWRMGELGAVIGHGHGRGVM